MFLQLFLREWNIKRVEKGSQRVCVCEKERSESREIEGEARIEFNRDR